MHASELATIALDQVLALQFLVAWAGEALSDPPRLSWWRTDVVDPLGGGDFLQRLAPRTHRWAALETVRRAASRADARARAAMPDADAVRTLFFWGFEIDEQLTERLRDLKSRQTEPDPDPYRDLPVTMTPDTAFDRKALESTLAELAPDVAWQALPNGRLVKSPMPDDVAQAARMLAASLVPFANTWLPSYFRLERRA